MALIIFCFLFTSLRGIALIFRINFDQVKPLYRITFTLTSFFLTFFFEISTPEKMSIRAHFHHCYLDSVSRIFFLFIVITERMMAYESDFFSHSLQGFSNPRSFLAPLFFFVHETDLTFPSAVNETPKPPLLHHLIFA